MSDFEAPEGLKPGGDGARLWAWLHSSVEGAETCGPMVEELCRIADRLAEVRLKIAQQGLTISGVRGRSAKNPLLDIEIKLSGQLAKLWKTLGLSDKPDQDSLPIGRPALGASR